MKKTLLILSILFVQVACFGADAPNVNNNNNGRYVMYMNPNVRADQFVLDTQTGKIWQMTAGKEGGVVFQQLLYDCYNNDKTFSGQYITPR
jgi:hypothetical protein